mgnify:CR=1 FL=1
MKFDIAASENKPRLRFNKTMPISQQDETNPNRWPMFLAVLLFFVFLNFIPRMDGPSGSSWWTSTVAQPERFEEHNTTNSTACLKRGFPFTFFRTHGSEFTTKTGRQLFLPTEVQPKWINRISLGMLVVDAAVATIFGIIASKSLSDPIFKLSD